MDLTDCLASIVERLQQRGFDEISDRDIVDKILDSLDESYATVISEIKERPDFEELHYAEIMTLLTIHEEKFGLANPLPRYSSEEGEVLSDYGSSHESKEHEEEDVENQHSIQREMEILTERLNQ